MGTPTLISGMDKYRLSSTATEIITAIEFAQMTAMTAGGKTRITINDVNDTILIEKFTPDVDLSGAEAELDEADVEGGLTRPWATPPIKGWIIRSRWEARIGFTGWISSILPLVREISSCSMP